MLETYIKKCNCKFEIGKLAYSILHCKGRNYFTLIKTFVRQDWIYPYICLPKQ